MDYFTKCSNVLTDQTNTLCLFTMHDLLREADSNMTEWMALENSSYENQNTSKKLFCELIELLQSQCTHADDDRLELVSSIRQLVDTNVSDERFNEDVQIVSANAEKITNSNTLRMDFRDLLIQKYIDQMLDSNNRLNLNTRVTHNDQIEIMSRLAAHYAAEQCQVVPFGSINILDMACGTGTLLHKTQLLLREMLPSNVFVYGTGVDNNTACVARSRILTFLRNKQRDKSIEYVYQDFLKGSNRFAKGGEYDLVVSCPVFGRWQGSKYDHRFSQYPEIVKADNSYGFLCAGMHSLRKGGTMLLAMDYGSIKIKGNCQEIRQQMTEAGDISAVIKMPVMRPYTGMPSAIVIARKGGMSEDIQFVDASTYIDPGIKISVFGRHKLMYKNIDELINLVISREEMEGVSTIVPRQIVAENDYSFDPQLYVNANDSKLSPSR